LRIREQKVSLHVIKRQKLSFVEHHATTETKWELLDTHLCEITEKFWDCCWRIDVSSTRKFPPTMSQSILHSCREVPRVVVQLSWPPISELCLISSMKAAEAGHQAEQWHEFSEARFHVPCRNSSCRAAQGGCGKEEKLGARKILGGLCPTRNSPSRDTPPPTAPQPPPSRECRNHQQSLSGSRLSTPVAVLFVRCLAERSLQNGW